MNSKGLDQSACPVLHFVRIFLVYTRPAAIIVQSSGRFPNLRADAEQTAQCVQSDQGLFLVSANSAW